MVTHGMRIRKTKFLGASFCARPCQRDQGIGLQWQDMNQIERSRLRLLITIFDAYVTGDFWYEIKVSILDQNGAVLNENIIKIRLK